jgi:U3 small nucleolar RNA-associated protein 15
LQHGKGLGKFRDTVLCAEIRKDGRLIVASDKSGAIRVIDPSAASKFATGVLRHWKPEEAHERFQVAKVKWAGATNFASAGDDKCVKVWDIMASTPLHTFVGHTDYVRALEAIPDSNLLLSGSLDGTARLWDSRVQDGVVATFKHGSETSGVVYSVLPLRGGTMFLTAGGSGIKVWDITAGSEVPVKETWNHQKEVTSLCPNADGSRVLAGGLDGHIKVYDTATWKVVHGMKYPNAILSVALSVWPVLGEMLMKSQMRNILLLGCHLLCYHYGVG